MRPTLGKLPIRATLVTRHGFSKHIKLGEGQLRDLQPVISIPVLESPGSPVEWPMDNIPPTAVCARQIQFQLERYRITEQKNGMAHIVCVYKELP